MGDRNGHLDVAKQLITTHIGKIGRCSSCYKTSAWGNSNQPEFYNQVIEIETLLPPEQLLEKILQIETLMGRKRIEKWGPRLIDIDLLFYNQIVLNSQRLTVPHPEIPARKFTLIPLTELEPEFVHPLLKKSLRTLLLECDDTLSVERI